MVTSQNKIRKPTNMLGDAISSPHDLSITCNQPVRVSRESRYIAQSAGQPYH